MTDIFKGHWTAHSWLPMGWRAAHSVLCDCLAPVMSLPLASLWVAPLYSFPSFV